MMRSKPAEASGCFMLMTMLTALGINETVIRDSY